MKNRIPAVYVLVSVLASACSMDATTESPTQRSAQAIGGHANPSNADYVVSVNGSCSGTLVAPTKVVTAQHCIHSGENRAGGVVATRATQIGARDVAVLTLSRALDLPTVRLAREIPGVGTKGTLIGFGRTEDSSAFDTRREARLRVYKVGSNVADESDRIGPTGFFARNADSRGCGADSGGAFMVGGMLAGVTVLGDPSCSHPDWDTGFAAVGSLYDQLSTAIED
ncbi:S1 family peptidase [Pendulispora brunnea]|uniref:S1 family peptidase n=1 Tax=Pendulispora brunnea TaxID=2905690 RepID=A0ABZ2KEM5_9BACT